MAAGEGAMTAPLDLLGVPVHPVTLADAVDAVVRAVEDWSDGEPFRHVAVNANKLLACRADDQLARAVAEADLATADGVGALLMARRLGLRLPERVTGIDLFLELLGPAAARGWPIYLLGAAPGVADAAATALQARHPDLVIAGARDGYFPAGSEDAVAQAVADSGARLLFVALPTPRKELFVQRHAHGVAFAMGVGGAFDVLCGRIPRAPRAVQQVGMEWAWRWAREPRRLAGRYGLGGVAFLRALVLGREAA